MTLCSSPRGGGSLNYFTPNIDVWALLHPQKTWKFTLGHFKPQKLMRKGHTASKSDGDPVYLLWTPILNSSIFYLFGLLTRVCARNLKNNTCVSENSTLLQISGRLWPPIQLKDQQGKSAGARIMCWKGATLSKCSTVPPITTCTNPPNALRPVLPPILVHYRAKVFRLVHTSLQKYWTNESYKNKNKKLSRGPDMFVNWRKQAMQRTRN